MYGINVVHGPEVLVLAARAVCIRNATALILIPMVDIVLGFK
jgi:hypothetical protein